MESNQNILGKLLSISAKAAKPINFEKALEYPLYPVPLSLAHPDGSKRSTQKSKLLQVLGINESNCILPQKEESALIIDMIAQFRMIVQELPNDFEGLIMKFLNSIPKKYNRVDIVADCYRDISIKTAEREKRGNSSKVYVRSVKSKVPRDITTFLSNSENKTQLINITFQYIIENKSKIMALLKTNWLYLSADQDCKQVTVSDCSDYDMLISDQEEADTKVVLHTLHALSENNETKVVIRSPSGDTDILVIALGIISQRERVYVDNGIGNHRKQLSLNEIDMEDNHRKALIGFHSFTGNDYVSAFFRKGKSVCWKTMIKSDEFVSAFVSLGQRLVYVR